MDHKTYSFKGFRLDPLARELWHGDRIIPLSASVFDCLVYLVEHRDRPVGRDELISAIWAKADVSDSLLAQTIVRLRRALGEDGKDQQIVKTMPRVGYRWMAVTSVHAAESSAEPVINRVESSLQAITDRPMETIVAPSISASAGRHPARRAWLVIVVFAFCAGLAWLFLASHRSPVPPVKATSRALAVVLPAEVRAPAQWAWLSLGAMALVADQLKASTLRVVPTPTVLALLNENKAVLPQTLFAKPELGISTMIQPTVALEGGNWTVTLSVIRAAQRVADVHASSPDVLEAARDAADMLLVRIGEPHITESRGALGAEEALYQQITAARLTGHNAVARSLVDSAPASQRHVPRMQFASAMVDCEGGTHLSDCKAKLKAALDAVPKDESQSELRGRVMIELGRRTMIDNPAAGEQLIREATSVLSASGDQDYLATAYLNLSYVEYANWNLEAASLDIGSARSSFATSGNALGLARSDFQEGIVADRRGQLDAAIAKLRAAEATFTSLGMKSMLPSTWDAMTSVQSARLQFADELIITDQFWPLNRQLVPDARLELALIRLSALLDNGKLTEAAPLMESMRNEPSLVNFPDLEAYVHVLRAKVAFDRGDLTAAANDAADALTPALENADRREYAVAWLLRIRALRDAGKASLARIETTKFGAWCDRTPTSSAWLVVYAGLAKAEQLVADAHREEALAAYRDTMAEAQRFGPPNLIVETGASYIRLALTMDRKDLALALSGTVANWAESDMRAAEAVALVYRATGKEAAERKATATAKQLAGERVSRGVAPWGATHR